MSCSSERDSQPGSCDSGSTRCGYCGSSVEDVLYPCVDTRNVSWSWGHCHGCGARTLLPAPTDEVLSDAYDSSYYGMKECKFGGFGEWFVSFFRKARARRYSAGLIGRARILDLGCGNGEFLHTLSQLGNYELWGIELDGTAARRAARHSGIHLKTGVLEPDDFGEDFFDLVTLFHVFEHLPNPRETLMMINSALKPGGRLVMSFPNIASAQAKYFRGHWFHLDPPRHLFLMPPDRFECAVGDYGYSVVRKTYFSVEQNPYGLIQSTLNRMGFPRDLLYERLKGNSAYCPEHGRGSLFFQKALAALMFFPGIVLDSLESVWGRSATIEYVLKKI